MSDLFVGCGFLGFLVCAVLLIVAVIKRKPKKPFVIGLAVCFALLCIGVAMPGSDVASDTPAVEQTQEGVKEEEPEEDVREEVKEEGEPKEEVEAEEETTNDANSTDEASKKEALAATISYIESLLSDNFGEDNYTVEYDDTGVTINVWEDGLATAASLAASGNQEAIDGWNSLTEVIATTTKTFSDKVAEVGYNDMTVVVNLLNDQNKDNVLLSVLNGVIIYDAVNSN